MPYDLSKSKVLSLIEFAPYLKISLEINGDNNELLFASESTGFGTIDSKSTTQNNLRPFVGNTTLGTLVGISLVDSIGYGACIELPFFPCRNECGLGYGRLAHFTYSRPPDRTGCIFKAKIAEADLPKVSKIVAKIEWIDPKPAK